MIDLQAYSVKELKHVAHILSRFEAEGLQYHEARKVLHDNIYRLGSLPRAKKVNRPQPVPKGPHERTREKCPTEGCVGRLEVYMRKDLDKKILMIAKCEKCSFSKIIDHDYKV